MLLTLSDIGKSFGAERIFEHLDAAIEPRDRIALIGPNGAGKTTLLNLIAGIIEPDEGTLSAQPDLRVGYLRQNGGLSPDGTIQSEMDDALCDLREIERKMLETGERMAEETDHQRAAYHALEQEYQQLDAQFVSRDGYRAAVRVNTVLTGMGFGSFDRETRVASLSGGERTRLLLCKLLLEAPELLILDEATNHLDFKMLDWLEEYLHTYRGAILTVSHDRYFLDRVTTATWELEGCALVCYPAPYSGYLVLREARIERMEKEFERHGREVARLQDYVDRNMVRATTASSAKSRLRMIEHLGEAEAPPKRQRPPVMHFTPKLRPVNDVLQVQGLRLEVGEGAERRILLADADFEVTRGERVAIVGENGAGKSTLLKTLIGKLSPAAGRIEWGRNVHYSVFEQDSSDLHSDKTALGELWDRFPRSNERELRTLLGGLQLTGDEAFKKVGVLSGGERARVKLAILTLEQGNVLVMDEPTNHLDIPAKEALEAALMAYEGTLLVVSHDRWLLSRLPTRILRLEGGTVESFEGGFAAMQQQIAARAAIPDTVSHTDVTTEPPTGEYHRSRARRAAEAAAKRRVTALEGEIAQTEAALSEAELQMSDPAVAGDYRALSELTESIGTLHRTLESLYGEWDDLV